MGVKANAVKKGGAVAGVIDMGDEVESTHSNTLAQSIANVKRKEAEELASQDFRKEWDAAIARPIQKIENRFFSVGAWWQTCQSLPSCWSWDWERITC